MDFPRATLLDGVNEVWIGRAPPEAPSGHLRYKGGLIH
jgi:hypothetical protein